jgi:hypothetical protein
LRCLAQATFLRLFKRYLLVRSVSAILAETAFERESGGSLTCYLLPRCSCKGFAGGSTVRRAPCFIMGASGAPAPQDPVVLSGCLERARHRRIAISSIRECSGGGHGIRFS